MKLLVTLSLLFVNPVAFSQSNVSVQVLADSLHASFRGLSVPADNIVWVSGSNGTVGRTLDGGLNWKWLAVPGFEKRDFRDIEAFDSLTAIIMAVDNPADILKTTDGGKTWKNVFHKEKAGMFLDAMDFNGNYGVCIGDPLEATNAGTRFFAVYTVDNGESWTEMQTPFAAMGEAIFAGSGSNIHAFNNRTTEAAFVTGGSISRLVLIDRDQILKPSSKIPMLRGKAAGVFSFCASGTKSFYCAGGDYQEYWKDSGNVAYTHDGGKSWNNSIVHGYRSCIIQVEKKTFITCGTNGVDISFDGCANWKLIFGDGAKGKKGFNVCAKSKTGKAVYFAGTGNIGKLTW